MIKRIGIIADTHDNIENIDKAINYFNQMDLDLIIHAGDIISPFIAGKFNDLKMDFVAVFGNNDGEKIGLKNVLKYKIFEEPHIFKISGKKFVVMHRERTVESLLKSKDYDVIIYGHTHKPDIRIENNTIVINPGEACGYMYGKSTVAILNLEKKEAKIIEVE